MDTTPPVITIQDEQPVYYISPDESSSIGVKDSALLQLLTDEDALVSSVVYDSQYGTVKTLLDEYAAVRKHYSPCSVGRHKQPA